MLGVGEWGGDRGGYNINPASHRVAIALCSWFCHFKAVVVPPTSLCTLQVQTCHRHQDLLARV